MNKLVFDLVFMLNVKCKGLIVPSIMGNGFEVSLTSISFNFYSILFPSIFSY